MLKSKLLSPNARLRQAAAGPPSIRKRPPDDDQDAVARIQKALVAFGHKLPKSFPGGPDMEPDGLYGPETESVVRDFQKQEFPNQLSQWDGRCGPNTLGKMDARLGGAIIDELVELPACSYVSVSRCIHKTPPSPVPIPYPNVSKAKGKASKPVRRFNFENAWPKG